jgi:hypothetical protein
MLIGNTNMTKITYHINGKLDLRRTAINRIMYGYAVYPTATAQRLRKALVAARAVHAVQ